MTDDKQPGGRPLGGKPQGPPEPSQPAPDGQPPGSPPPGGQPQGSLTPEEQMALYEEDLKENDWGHQPC